MTFHGTEREGEPLGDLRVREPIVERESHDLPGCLRKAGKGIRHDEPVGQVVGPVHHLTIEAQGEGFAIPAIARPPLVRIRDRVLGDAHQPGRQTGALRIEAGPTEPGCDEHPLSRVLGVGDVCQRSERHPVDQSRPSPLHRGAGTLISRLEACDEGWLVVILEKVRHGNPDAAGGEWPPGRLC